ncbi:MAG: 3-hydroxyacyl-CoA dehydrogenase [Rhizobacter sp.]|nr:3-hydroxyacyl-CoA dehydrogenase [Rhizobacter sp.]
MNANVITTSTPAADADAIVIAYVRDEHGVVTLTIDMPGQATNIMNAVFREALEAAVSRLERERADISGVIVSSGKKTFFAGGDLNALLATRPEDAQASFDRGMAIKAMLRRLERLGRPVVAAVDGSALGGGFEICLACHARFVLADEKILLGQPEATLGLLPGAGGVVRSVRMLGLEVAVPLLVDGAVFGPAKALALGLVTGLAADRPSLMTQAREWIAAHPEPLQPWDVKGFRIPGATAAAPAPLTWLRTQPMLLMKKYRGLYPAVEAVMSAAVEGATVDFDTASRIESRYLTHLAAHPVSKNMITTFFFQMNEIRSGQGRPAGLPPSRVERIGILGAGLMGAGIAPVAAHEGMKVQLGKTPIVVNDSRGFFTSRVFGTYTKEGAAMLAEGVPPAVIENAALSVGMPIGPLAVMDETSMALAWSLHAQTVADLAEAGEPVPQHPGWEVIRHMVETAKRPGRAGGGGGFYDYPEGGRKQLWPGLADAFPPQAGEPAWQELRDRLLYIQAIESVRCLEEGVIGAARDANIGSVLGIGFPRWTGGTLRYIDSVGLRAFVLRARELAARHGSRFEPPALLVMKAERQETFSQATA